MPARELQWRADAQGVLVANVHGYRVTVERLAPSAESRFIVWNDQDPPGLMAAGVRPTSIEAMQAGEEAAMSVVNLGKPLP